MRKIKILSEQWRRWTHFAREVPNDMIKGYQWVRITWDVIWVFVEMLGPCLVQFVLCVFILSSLWSHPLRINTHHGDGATTLYRRSRLDARHERASPIRLENFGLTGVVCWDTFKSPTSNKFILFIFVFILLHIVSFSKFGFPMFFWTSVPSNTP